MKLSFLVKIRFRLSNNYNYLKIKYIKYVIYSNLSRRKRLHNQIRLKRKANRSTELRGIWNNKPIFGSIGQPTAIRILCWKVLLSCKLGIRLNAFYCLELNLRPRRTRHLLLQQRWSNWQPNLPNRTFKILRRLLTPGNHRIVWRLVMVLHRFKTLSSIPLIDSNQHLGPIIHIKMGHPP